MRIPIAHALAWPDRVDSGVQTLDLLSLARLDFAPPDTRRFPCLALARQAMSAGGTAPAILNAANEVAVHAFLESQLRFTDISAVIDHCMGQLLVHPADNLDNVLSDDREARAVAWAAVRGMREVSVR
jgi:1-deoxy-D-xylulose-5-phosphate reductoisomerase